MSKLLWAVIISSGLLVSSCTSGGNVFMSLVPLQRYTVVGKTGEPQFTAVATKGGLRASRLAMEERGNFRFYGNSGDVLSGVSFRTNIYLGDFNPEGETAVARIHRQGLGDFERAIAERLTQRYTAEFKERLGLTLVEGKVFYLKGFKCVRFNEYQNYLGGISFAASAITCPVFINGEPGVFGSSYNISMIAEKYHQTYGEKAKSFDELMAYHERLIEPIYDSIEFFKTVTQEFPEQGVIVAETLDEKYPEYDAQGNQTNTTSEHSTYECVVNCGNDGTGERTEPRAANEVTNND